MTKKTLILFLGNPIFSDDKIALILGENLKGLLESEGYNVEIVEKTGFSLLDYLENQEEVVIVDSIRTGKHEVGEIVPVRLEDFIQFAPLTTHYVGIPEALELMRQLDLNPPKQVHVLGVEVEDPYTISEEMSNKLKGKLIQLCREIHSTILSYAETNETKDN